MKIFWILIISGLLTNTSLVRAENNFLTFGIFPYVSTSKLVAHNKEALNHIGKTTKYTLSLVSAKNVQIYINNLKSYKYDFIFSAPHLARFAEKKYGYQRVAMTSHKIRGVYLVKKDSSLKTLNNLMGKNISMAPAITLLHQMALSDLSKAGIKTKINIVNTHNNAIYDVLNNVSDAAVTGIKIWQNLPKDKKEKLRVLADTEPASGFIVMAKPGLDQTVLKDIQESFLSFNNTPEAKRYLFKGFKLISDQEMQSLDLHAKVFE